jgi:hypothetical protein
MRALVVARYIADSCAVREDLLGGKFRLSPPSRENEARQLPLLWRTYTDQEER